MKGKVSILVILFSLLLMCFVASVNAASVVPDGLVGIPWGANRDQIIKSMNERGYTTHGTIIWGGMAPSTLVFKGAFDGVPCQLEFDLKNNAFYIGRATLLGLFTSPVYLEGLYKRMVSQFSTKYGSPQYDKLNEWNNGKERSWRAIWELVDSESSDKYGIMVYVDIPGASYYSNAPNPNKPEPSVTISYHAVSLGEKLQKKEY